jgi:hypothetical protein
MTDKLTKNHRGATKEKSTEARIVATKGGKCPLQCVEIYLSKLHPENKFLWQRPKRSVTTSASCWYDNMKVGVNKINKFMKILSEKCILSKTYTNHAPRATCITILGDKFADTDVASHSGHKSLSAMSIYKRTSDTKKTSMSQALSSTLHATDNNATHHSSSNNHEDCCISFGVASEANLQTLQVQPHIAIVENMIAPTENLQTTESS